MSLKQSVHQIPDKSVFLTKRSLNRHQMDMEALPGLFRNHRMQGITKNSTRTTCSVHLYAFLTGRVKFFTGSDIRIRSVKKQRAPAVHL